VTPIVLPRFPRRGLTPEDVISHACITAGYPEPAAVRVQYAPLLEGAPHARSFPNSAGKPSMPPRLRMHATIHFRRIVRGPVAIGAGRYQGLGFCRPTPERQLESQSPMRADIDHPVVERGE
jgi:CRISPR-associated protein Csb2